MQSLQTLMQQLERSPRWQASASFRQLLALWPQLVGAAVAQHSHPQKIQRNVLLVSVSSAAWAQTLTFERCAILAKLHQRIPTMKKEIQDIRFATARWSQSFQPALTQTFTQPVEHPSWIPVSRPTSKPSPETVDEAFQKWAQRIHSQFSEQSLCPECHCPCPKQELARWPACAVCMPQRWKTYFTPKKVR